MNKVEDHKYLGILVCHSMREPSQNKKKVKGTSYKRKEFCEVKIECREWHIRYMVQGSLEKAY